MIMSYYANLEMPYQEGAIILLLQGGLYGRKGHYRNQPKGIKEVTRNS